MKIGYLGLGKMGENMVMRLLEQGIEVVAWNRSSQPLDEVAAAGAIATTDPVNLVSKLEVPRIVWLMFPAGEITDEFINQLIPLLSPGDLVIDGANSFYEDTIRRAKLLAEKSIRFMDIGVSGGPGGARTGACLMVGGKKADYEEVLPLIKAASAPNAYCYMGPVGAGHFTKMVHNGIEYGMMESIAEGFAVLKKSPFKIDLRAAADIYQHRSVVESRLMGWLKEALDEDENLAETSSLIGATGEGEWTVKTAQKLDVNTPVIADSFRVRTESAKVAEESADGFRNKAVSAMRGKFGQHKVKKS